MALIRTNVAGGGSNILSVGDCLSLLSNTGASNISAYTSGTAITMQATAGAFLVALNTGAATVALASASSMYSTLVGLKNGAVVSSEHQHGNSTKAFTGCDYVLALYNASSQIDVALTVTDA